MENAEIQRPNREAIAVYKESLGAKSGKSKAGDTESSDEGPEDLEDDQEDQEFDVLGTDDDSDKDGEDLDEEVDEEGGEASGNKIDSDSDEDDAPEENIKLVNTSLSFISISLLPLRLITWYIGLGLQKVKQISQCKGFCIEVTESTSTSPSENSE